MSGSARILHRLSSMQIQSYRQLDAWKLGMALVVEIYRVTARFPNEERYGLTAQLRRAAVSIPSNIAEGYQLGTRAYRRSVRIAIGSLAETETQVELSRQLQFASEPVSATLLEKAGELRRILHGLHRSLTRRICERAPHSAPAP
jgi:four helix bundle protein